MLTPNTLDATLTAVFCCIHRLSDKEVTTAQEEIFLLDKTINSTIYIIARVIIICFYIICLYTLYAAAFEQFCAQAALYLCQVNQARVNNI